MHIKYFLCILLLLLLLLLLFICQLFDTETLSIGHPTHALLNRSFVSVGLVTWVLIIDHMTTLR